MISQGLSQTADGLALIVVALVSLLCVLAAIVFVIASVYLCIVLRANSLAAKSGLFQRLLAVVEVLFAAIGAYATTFQAYVAWIVRK